MPAVVEVTRDLEAVVNVEQTRKKKPTTKKPRLVMPPTTTSAPRGRSRRATRAPSTQLTCPSPTFATHIASTCVLEPSFRHSAPTTSTSTSSTSSTGSPKKPSAKKCNKKTGTCTHEIVFGLHYDRKDFAEHVRLAKSATDIDPDYIA